MGELASACEDLESYLAQAPNAEDASFIRQLVAQIRQNL
jgi:regulator of sirC expression with transglutaminase-like and TPR domain